MGVQSDGNLYFDGTQEPLGGVETNPTPSPSIEDAMADRSSTTSGDQDAALTGALDDATSTTSGEANTDAPDTTDDVISTTSGGGNAEVTETVDMKSSVNHSRVNEQANTNASGNLTNSSAEVAVDGVPESNWEPEDDPEAHKGLPSKEELQNVSILYNKAVNANLNASDDAQAFLGSSADSKAVPTRLHEKYVGVALPSAPMLNNVDAFAREAAWWNHTVQSHADAHVHATKGGNLNHSGYSAFGGIWDISVPAWSFAIPRGDARGLASAGARAFYGSPVVDNASNIYIQSTAGTIFSLEGASGRLRWRHELDSSDPQYPSNLALANGTLFTCSRDGTAWAFNMSTGWEQWRRQIADHCSDDAFSPTAVGDIVLFACNPSSVNDAQDSGGNVAVCAVSTTDGSEVWTYSLRPHHGKGYNMAPAVVGDRVFFGDVSGASYCISLRSGRELWYHPGTYRAMFTTGGLVVGPDNRAYNGFNMGEDGDKGPRSTGLVTSHDLETGRLLWNKSFPEGVNAAPAVGPYGAQGATAVVVAVGYNLDCSSQPKLTFKKNAQIVVLDAETAEEIWSFDAPPYALSCAGNSPEQACCPSVWSQPTLAADGTVYVNWSGGKLFALRDVNSDGKIDANNPAEFAFFHHGKGSNSQSALVPGMLVAACCDRVLAFSQ